MKKAWELFPKLTVAVKADHAGRECGHHLFEHALMVAQYALIIAEDEETGRLAADVQIADDKQYFYSFHPVRNSPERNKNCLVFRRDVLN